jgi:cytochrome P450
LKIALEELLARIDDFRPAGDVDWMPNNRLLGIRHFPMTVSKSKRAA